MNLYNIATEYQVALDGIEVNPETGEVTGLGALDEINSAFEEKTEAIGCYAKGVKAEAEAIKAERDMLDKRMKAAQRKLEMLKTYLEINMNAVGKDRLKTPRCTISFRKTSKVEVSDIDNLPDEFKKVTIEPRKSDIATAIKTGAVVPGVTIVKSRSIQIR